jgi:hypothetical protein
LRLQAITLSHFTILKTAVSSPFFDPVNVERAMRPDDTKKILPSKPFGTPSSFILTA